jgi:hypothetical protein
MQIGSEQVSTSGQMTAIIGEPNGQVACSKPCLSSRVIRNICNTSSLLLLRSNGIQSSIALKDRDVRPMGKSPYRQLITACQDSKLHAVALACLHQLGNSRRKLGPKRKDPERSLLALAAQHQDIVAALS